MKDLTFIILTILILLSCQNSVEEESESSDTLQEEAKEISSNRSKPMKEQPKERTDLFNDALKELHKVFQYRSQDTVGTNLYTTDRFEFNSLLNGFIYCSDSSSENNSPVCGINFSLINEMKSSFIKADEPIEGNLYLKATIQEWTLDKSKTAKIFETDLNQCITDKQCVNKGGIKWWRVKNKIYVITTPAYRYSFEIDDIIKVMNRILKKEV